jgi:hypothetical protein
MPSMAYGLVLLMLCQRGIGLVEGTSFFGEALQLKFEMDDIIAFRRALGCIKYLVNFKRGNFKRISYSILASRNA